MPSPVITFRLSHHQLARGLQIIRSLEPTFQFTSLNQVVKIIYNNYVTKMSLGSNNEVDPKILSEVESFINTPIKRTINLSTLVSEE